jgi:ATP-dependent helicase HrpB
MRFAAGRLCAHPRSGFADLSDAALLDVDRRMAPAPADRQASPIRGRSERLAGRSRPCSAIRAGAAWTGSRPLVHQPGREQPPIDYQAEAGRPSRTAAQALFGLADHPRIAGGAVPARPQPHFTRRPPIQTTRDLPGFWSGSWSAVAKEMRAATPATPGPTTRPRRSHLAQPRKRRRVMSSDGRSHRHCERSEAIHLRAVGGLLRLRLAMTISVRKFNQEQRMAARIYQVSKMVNQSGQAHMAAGCSNSSRIAARVPIRSPAGPAGTTRRARFAQLRQRERSDRLRRARGYRLSCGPRPRGKLRIQSYADNFK